MWKSRLLNSQPRWELRMNLIKKFKEKFAKADEGLREIEEIGDTLSKKKEKGSTNVVSLQKEEPKDSTTPQKELRPA